VRTLSLPDWARVTLLYLCDEQQGTPAGSPDDSPAHKQASATQLPPDIYEPFATEAISYLHDCGVAVRWIHRRGHPASQLLSVAREQEANLIVLGAKEHSPIMSLPEPSVTQCIVKNAPCSVLLVRQSS
jgi:nucleotide-binding universal stress UspA family protein